ncbi:hypothetical protein B0H16DRAFT_1695868 [Mycena metata]|uniref:DUF7779 domain-containing protein n=1 Tax=Mycena metata TaxID=1033252 RepID=A0AAD7I5C4_9AGAR|nr:hypothetical protein B0H16DRAFT_1695868 [Mycena metata]
MSSGSTSTSPPPTPKRKGAFRPFKATSRSSGRKSDSLALLIAAAEAATTAGQFAPFPCVQGACGTFVTLLKAVENVRRNQEDLAELCEKIKEIVDILQILASGATIAVRLKDVCEEFERFFQEMLVAVARMQTETEGFRGQIKGFIKSSRITAEIAGYEKRIQGLISNINVCVFYFAEMSLLGPTKPQLITGFDTNSRVIKIESTFNAVHAMISPNLSTVQVSQQTNNCPPASRIFQGRGKILTKMQEYFAQDMDKQYIYVLHGLGGAGKTQIALKFIQQSFPFTNTFFVDASTVETIETGFKNIAKLQRAGDSSDDAVKWLVAQHKDWLLFFDNADDPKLDLYKFLPPCNHGNIITSRNPELRFYGSDSAVSGMDEEDAIALLLKSGGVEQITSSDEKTAADITKVLWYLPLAIVQAGAFIAKFGALNQYLDLYAKNHNKLLREKPSQSHSDYEWTVYTTWQMSFDQLSPAAAILLQLCSFLHREGISEDIFSRAAGYNFPSLGPSKEELQQPLKFLSQFQSPDGKWDTISFLELTTEIMSYSLATFESEKNTFSIHPLVHQWTQDILANPESEYCITYNLIGMSICGIPRIHLRLISLKLVPHVDAIMQFKALINGDEHQDTLYLMHGLAETYMRLDQLKEAEELHVTVLKKRRLMLGEEHLQTLDAMSSLANTYVKLGQFHKAKELQLVVVEKQRGVCKPVFKQPLVFSHGTGRGPTGGAGTKKIGEMVLRRPQFALREVTTALLIFKTRVRNNIQDPSQKAKELELVVVEKRTAILGADHLDTLSAMYNLALTYSELDQFQEAEKLEQVVVEKRSTILGVAHLDTLSAMQNLAVTYLMLNQLENAQKLQTEVMKKLRTIRGDDHPLTILSIRNLALTCRALGKVTEAEDLEVLLPDGEEGTTHGGRLPRLRTLKHYFHTMRRT